MGAKRNFPAIGAALCALLLFVGAAQADPPGRIGRLAAVDGGASIYDEDSASWQPAPVNWPISGGDTLWTGPGDRADIRIGATVVRMDGSSELQFLRLDDEAVQVRLLGGSIAVRLADAEAAQEFRVDTEQGHTSLLEPGRYRFDFADGATAVSVYAGQCAFEGNGQAYLVAPGQRAEFWYSGNLDMRLSDLRRDDFFDWVRARDHSEERWGGPRYVSANMTGYEDLNLYGDWEDGGDYGEVWVPRLVPIGWTPYRHGRWALIAPWGWTWIDDAPWGFAPFHYGRWAWWRGRWAWAPGHYEAHPIFAPALVAWIGRPGGAPLRLGDAPAAGWFPLAPRERYEPPYQASERYRHGINAPHLRDGERSAGGAAPGHYANRDHPHAVTVVPLDTLTRGRPVRDAVDRNFDARALAGLPINSDAPAHWQAPHGDAHDRERQPEPAAARPPIAPMHGHMLRPPQATPPQPTPPPRDGPSGSAARFDQPAATAEHAAAAAARRPPIKPARGTVAGQAQRERAKAHEPAAAKEGRRVDAPQARHEGAGPRHEGEGKRQRPSEDGKKER